MGGNIGVPVLALEPFAPGRAYVLEVSSYQIDLAPSLKPTRRHSAQRVGRPSRPPRQHGELRRHQGAGCRRRRAGRHRGDRRRRPLHPRRRRPHRARRQKSRARVGASRRCATAITPKAAASCAPPAARRIRWRSSPASASLRGAAQCAERGVRALPPAWRSASTCRRSRRGCVSFPACAHRMQQVGAQGQRAVRQRLQGDQRRFRRQGAGELQRHFLDRRRQAEDRRHHQPRRILPAHPQGLSDRRGGARSLPRRWTARCRTRSTACCRRPSTRPRATPRPRASRSRWCCCRRPAPRSTSTRTSRCAARPSRDIGAGDPGIQPAVTVTLMLRKP